GIAARPGAADRRHHHPARGARRRAVHGVFRIPEFSARLRQFPHAVAHADCIVVRRDSAVRIADRAVHDRAAGERLAQRIRSSARSVRGGGRRARGGGTDRGADLSAPLILALMTFLFLLFGYMGVPVAFSLLAGVLAGTLFTDVTFPTIIQK